MSDAPPAGTPAATPAHGTSAPAAAEAKPAQVTGRRGRRESVDVLWHYCAYLVVNTCRGNYMIIIDGVTDILITRDVSQYVSFYNDPPRPPQNKKVTEFLKTILGRPVVVKLNSGVDYRGRSIYCETGTLDVLTRCWTGLVEVTKVEGVEHELCLISLSLVAS